MKSINKIRLPATMLFLLLANVSVMADPSASDKWQMEVDSIGSFSGRTVIANTMGPATLYVLSDGENTIKIRERQGAQRHSIILNEKATARTCSGLVSIDWNDQGLGLFSGEVACGKVYRPDQKDHFALSGSFKIKDK